MSRRLIIDGGQQASNHLHRAYVILEELAVQDDSAPGEYVLAVIGKVRTSNFALEKFVFARVTFNNWASYRDYSGIYTESSENGESDLFAFGFTRRDKRPVRVEIALSTIQNGTQYWDNNNGKNYCFYLREDPFNDPEPTRGAEPEMITTWQVADESSGQTGDDIVFETSSYSHFQGYPVNPTKLRYYSSMKVAAEKDVVPTKVKGVKHIHASNVLALESLLRAEAEQAQNAGGEQIEAVSANAEECEITLTVTETAGEEELDGQQAVVNCSDAYVTEESVEPVKVVKPVDDKTQDEVFDKFKKEQQEISVELQVTEEPGIPTENNETDGERKDDIQQQSGYDGNNGATQVEAQSASTALNDTEKQPGETKHNKKKKTKKEKKTSKKDKLEISFSNLETAQETDLNSKDDRSLSSRKERIENEELPKNQKKGFLSKLACCGKAEPD